MTVDATASGARPPTVSVVIAAWNARDHIARSVDSALAQEGVDAEVIVINDASTDGTRDFLETTYAGNARVNLVSLSQNGGPSAARNAGIAAAAGNWVAILDADDEFVPGRLAAMCTFAEQHQADLVFDLFKEVDETGATLSEAPPIKLKAPEQWSLTRWAMDNRPMHGFCTGYLKPLIRREFLSAQSISYQEHIRNSEDYVLVAEVLARGGRVWALPSTGYVYTRRSGSLSARRSSKQIEHLLEFDEALVSTLEAPDSRLKAALGARVAALRDVKALSEVVEDLKSGRPLAALSVALRRPRAAPVFFRWIGEVFGKRLGLINKR